MILKLRVIFICLKLCIKFILQRPFGSVLHDVADKYDDITITDLRSYEKLKTKINKAELDVDFLNRCKEFNVYPIKGNASLNLE